MYLDQHIVEEIVQTVVREQHLIPFGATSRENAWSRRGTANKKGALRYGRVVSPKEEPKRWAPTTVQSHPLTFALFREPAISNSS